MDKTWDMTENKRGFFGNIVTKRAVFLTCLSGIYLLLVRRALHFLPLGNQVWDLALSDSLCRGVKTAYLAEAAAAHPPFYSFFVCWLVKLSGLSVVPVSRLMGVLCFLVNLPLIYFITLKLAKEGRREFAAVLAVLLYVFSPVAVQGSQVLKMDTSIFPPAILLFTLVFLGRVGGSSFAKNAFLGMFFAMVLMAKVTTGFVIIPAIFLFYVLNSDYIGVVCNVAVIALCGVGVYLSVWLIVRQFYPSLFSEMPFWTHLLFPFRLYRESLELSGTGGLMREWMKSLLIMPWFSPFFSALWLAAVWKGVKDYFASGRLKPGDFLILCSGLILAAYFGTGGLSYGFPRFQYPAFLLCAVTVAVFLAETEDGLPEIFRSNIIFSAAGIAVFSVFAYFFSGDLIFTAYYELKEALISGDIPVKTVFIKAAFQFSVLSAGWLFLYLTARFVLGQRHRKNVFLLSLLLAAAGEFISRDIRSLNVDYMTGFTYGGSGVSELVEHLSAEYRAGRKILAPDDVYFNVPGVFLSTRMGDNVWNRKDDFIAEIKSRDPDIIVYGLCSNNVYQYLETFANRQVRQFLETRYSEKKYGSYTLWNRR